MKKSSIDEDQVNSEDEYKPENPYEKKSIEPTDWIKSNKAMVDPANMESM